MPLRINIYHEAGFCPLNLLVLEKIANKYTQLHHNQVWQNNCRRVFSDRLADVLLVIWMNHPTVCRISV